MIYRIYDKEEKRYLLNYEGHIETTGLVISRYNVNASNITEKIDPNIQNKFEVELGIELFTNEDDYVNKLYEGDIVKCKTVYPSAEELNGLIGKISFLEGAFYLEFNDKMFLLHNDSLEYEVVGNVHDNYPVDNFYRSYDVYENFINKMLDTPNDRFEITVNNAVTIWELKLDDYGIFRIHKDNRDETVELWFTVDGTSKSEKINKKDLFDKWHKKYELYKQEQKEKFEQKAKYKLEKYLTMKWG